MFEKFHFLLTIRLLQLADVNLWQGRKYIKDKDKKLVILDITHKTILLQFVSHLQAMAISEKFCLKWNDYQENVNNAFAGLRKDSEFADVTLSGWPSD